MGLADALISTTGSLMLFFLDIMTLGDLLVFLSVNSVVCEPFVNFGRLLPG